MSLALSKKFTSITLPLEASLYFSDVSALLSYLIVDHSIREKKLSHCKQVL